jgi:HEAT repeat protein
MMRKLILSALLVSSTLVATPAFAGRGASYGSIMDAISSNNGDVIASELERAEFLACAACTGPVMELLDHPSYQVREVAAWWLARRPALADAATVQSIARLQGSDATAAEYAADVLGAFKHPRAIASLAAGLNRSDFPASTKVAMVRAIGIIGDPSGMSAVAGALADNAPETRAEAVRAYDSIRGARGGTELVPLLVDSDKLVRRQAAASVAPFRLSTARAQLENLLANDADPLVRRNAAFALLKLHDPASRPVLQKAADSDAVMFVRSTAKAALSGN